MVSNILYFHLENWGRIPVLTLIFQMGLVQPLTRWAKCAKGHPPGFPTKWRWKSTEAWCRGPLMGTVDHGGRNVFSKRVKQRWKHHRQRATRWALGWYIHRWRDMVLYLFTLYHIWYLVSYTAFCCLIQSMSFLLKGSLENIVLTKIHLSLR